MGSNAREIYLIAAPVHGDVDRVGEELHEEEVGRETEGAEAAAADVLALLGEHAEVLVVVHGDLGYPPHVSVSI